MGSTKLLKINVVLLTLIVFSSCKEQKRVLSKIDFNTAYKFSSEIEDKVAKDTTSWKYQLSASDYATKGDYKNALIQWDLAMNTIDKSLKNNQIDSINKTYSKINARNYIIEQAKQNKVVIINEAHHNSLHRAFTKSLLKKLFDNGYKNLGLEALGNGTYLDSTLNNRKYPILDTGYYIKDPQFGDLVREALEIGYHIFPYEHMGKGSGKPREIEQAKNIAKEIQSKPKEKFLIHCGFDHALEGTHTNWEKAMAGRVTEYTGINPLTINQVVYSEKSKPEFNHPLLKALNINESTILLDKDNHPLKYERGASWMDVSVFHPNTVYVDNRPHWLFQNDTEKVSLLLTDIQIAFPVMVLAYKKGEDVNLAIPIDITEVQTQAQKCTLGLKKGTYSVVVTNGQESVIFEQLVN